MKTKLLASAVRDRFCGTDTQANLRAVQVFRKFEHSQCASQAEAPRLEVPSVAAARTRPKLIARLQSDVHGTEGSETHTSLSRDFGKLRSNRSVIQHRWTRDKGTFPT